MVPTDPHREFRKGVSLARTAAGSSGSRRADIHTDAWDAVRCGVKFAKQTKDLVVLEGWSEQQMADVLHMLVQRSNDKPVLKSQVVETLMVLLSCRAWLAASQADPCLADAIQGLVHWKEHLNCGRGEKHRLRETVVPLQICNGTIDAQQGRHEHVLDGNLMKFREGVLVMEQHGWQFPMGQTRALDFDGATEAFEQVHAITKQLLHVKDYPSCDYLECFSPYWPGMLLFFQRLHHRRPSYRSRVRFVAAGMSDLSSSFRRAFDEVRASSPAWPGNAAVHSDKDKDLAQADPVNLPGSATDILRESQPSSSRDVLKVVGWYGEVVHGDGRHVRLEATYADRAWAFASAGCGFGVDRSVHQPMLALGKPSDPLQTNVSCSLFRISAPHPLAHRPLLQVASGDKVGTMENDCEMVDLVRSRCRNSLPAFLQAWYGAPTSSGPHLDDAVLSRLETSPAGFMIVALSCERLLQFRFLQTTRSIVREYSVLCHAQLEAVKYLQRGASPQTMAKAIRDEREERRLEAEDIMEITPAVHNCPAKRPAILRLACLLAMFLGCTPLCGPCARARGGT